MTLMLTLIIVVDLYNLILFIYMVDGRVSGPHISVIIFGNLKTH